MILHKCMIYKDIIFISEHIMLKSSGECIGWSRGTLMLVEVWMLPGWVFSLFQTQNVPDVVHYKVYCHWKHTTTKPCTFLYDLYFCTNLRQLVLLALIYQAAPMNAIDMYTNTNNKNLSCLTISSLHLNILKWYNFYQQ